MPVYVLFAYDITDDRRRERAAKILEGYGFRVQKSLFECFLEEDLIREAIGRLMEVIDPEEDDLRVYRLCGACWGRREGFGRAVLTDEPKKIII